MAEGNGNGRIDRIEDALESLISNVASLTDVTRLIAGQFNRLAEAQIEIQDTVAELAEQVVALAENQRALAESQRTSREQTEEALRRLAEAQQHTDERLNALIDTVDDIIRRTSPPPPS